MISRELATAHRNDLIAQARAAHLASTVREARRARRHRLQVSTRRHSRFRALHHATRRATLCS